MRIQHNISALNTHRNLSFNNTQTSKALEKLSSGYKINRAGDDAAGLAISEKMRGQIRGLDMASKNAQDGISLIQTTEGALNETHSILQRMRELAVQAGNDTNTADDRGEIQKEINQLTSEINRIGNTTEFNTKKLLNGQLSDEVAKPTTITADTAAYTPVFANGVTWSEGNKGEIKDNKIDFSTAATNGTAFGWDTVKPGATDKFTITRNGDDFTLDVYAEDATTKIEINGEKLSKDTSGNFNYDANGIKFTIEADKVKDWADKGTFNLSFADKGAGAATVDLTAATGVGTKSTFTQTLVNPATSTPAAFTAAGVEVDNDPTKGYIEGTVGVKLTATDLDSVNAQYTVELLDKDGKTLHTETVKPGAATTGISYNQHGVKFELEVEGAKSVNMTQDFEYTETSNGTADQSVKFQIGANENQALTVSISDMRASALGIVGKAGDAGYTKTNEVNDGTDNTMTEAALDLSNHENAAAAITTIDKAINSVSSERAKLGAVQNRLEHTINNLGASSENLTAAESRIRDTDMAASMMEFTKNNILTQAAQSMLAQANQQPQGVLQLLG